MTTTPAPPPPPPNQRQIAANGDPEGSGVLNPLGVVVHTPGEDGLLSSKFH